MNLSAESRRAAVRQSLIEANALNEDEAQFLALMYDIYSALNKPRTAVQVNNVAAMVINELTIRRYHRDFTIRQLDSFLKEPTDPLVTAYTRRLLVSKLPFLRKLKKKRKNHEATS